MKIELSREEMTTIINALDELTSVFDVRDVGENEALTPEEAAQEDGDRRQLMNRMKALRSTTNNGQFAPGKLILHTPSERGGKITHVNPADSDWVCIEWATVGRDKIRNEWIHVKDLQLWT